MPKYLIFGSVVFIAQGLIGIVDDFYYILKGELERRRGVDTLYELKIVAEDIIMELTRRYEERVGQRSPIGVLLAGLENIAYGPAKLYSSCKSSFTSSGSTSTTLGFKAFKRVYPL